MRVVFPTPEFVTESANFDGGLASYLSRVTRALMDFGHEPVVLVASDRTERLQWEGIMVQRVQTSSRMVRLADRLTRHRCWPTIRWTWQGRMLARAAQEWCGDRLDVLVQYPNYTSPGRAHRSSAPSVIRFSSFEPLWRELHGHGAGDSIARQIERMEFGSVAKAKALFAPSRFVAQLVEARTARSVEVIPSPFSPDCGSVEPSREPLEEWKRAPYFFFFGSLSPMKGTAVIARVLEPVLQAHPGWHFVFAGRDLGPRDRPIWPELARAAGAARARVHYLGRLERRALPGILADAAVVVLPSVADNMPNTVLEAMGAGRLVVGTRRTSIDELITDGRDGLLCEPNDPAALLKALNRAVALSEPERRVLGRAARQRVEQLRPEITIAALMAFYQRVLGNKS